MIAINKVENIRSEFISKLKAEDFVIDKTGVKMVEIINASFVADEETIFGTLNKEYADKEIKWYESQSLSVYDIPAPIPEIWKQVASEHGYINSNYGWCIFSYHNYDQYKNVKNELLKSPYSRRAVMIYTRPKMWYEFNKDGMSDFMCTNAVQYLIRNDKLHAVVQMRSNDAVFGFKNDRYWQLYVLVELARDLNVEVGDIHWNAGSLHVYERHFHLIK